MSCNCHHTCTEKVQLISDACNGRYTMRLIIPGRSCNTVQWQWGVATVNEPVDIVSNALFAHSIAPIIFINGTPVKWAVLGILQNKKNLPGEEDQVAFLDFTNYTIGNGIITGAIDFQYIQP